MKKILARFLLPAFLALLGPVVGLCDETPFVLRIDKLCGVDTYHAPNTLLPCQVQSASNVLFDQNSLAQMREGYVTYLNFGTSAPVRGLWPYRAADGTDWLLGQSSGSFLGYNGSSTSTLITGLDSDARMDCASCLGALYCTDRSTWVFSFNGSSITYDTGAPKASLVECWRNRVALGDVSGSQSTLYLSGELHGNDWVTGTKSTSPVTWRVGGVDDAGNRIRCLKTTSMDLLYIGAPYKSFGFYGNDQRDFRLRHLFDAGCIDDGTVQEHLGELTWVSDKGVERFDRNVLKYPRVSEPIRGVTDALSASSSQEFSWIQTTQSDFQAGTSSSTTPNITPASVELGTWTAVDTSSTDFISGTLTNVTTSSVDGSVVLSTNSSNLINSSFESSSGGLPDNWTVGEAGGAAAPFVVGVDGGVSPFDGASMMKMLFSRFGGGIHVELYDADASSLLTSSFEGAGGGTRVNEWRGIDLNTADFIGRNVCLRVKFDASVTGYGSSSIISDPFFCNGGIINIKYYVVETSPGAGHDGYMYLDYQTGGRSTIYDGSFVSQAFDTHHSSSAWLSSSFSTTTNSHAITMETQTSSDSVTWTTLANWPSGSAPVSDWNRYIRYKVSMSTLTDGIGLPSFQDATLSARFSSGTFITQAKNFGTMTRFGRFESNETTDGGAIHYYIRTASSAVLLNAATWFSQTPFTTVAASSNTWGQYRADFSITLATQNPSHYDGTIFWLTGADRPAMASAVYRDRWHLFYTTSSAETSANDMVAPLDRNLVWTFFNGINAASAATFRGDLLVGDSAASGKVFRLYSGYYDDGTAITSHVQMKDLDADDEDARKTFSKMYVTLGHEQEAAQDVDVDMSYTVDGDSEEFSLGPVNLGENVGRINARVPFGLSGSNLNIGNWIAPKFSWSSLGAPVSLYGLRLYGFKEEVQ